MSNLFTRDQARAVLSANYNRIEREVIALCGPGTPFPNVAQIDHKTDLAASMFMDAPALVVEIEGLQPDEVSALVLDALRALFAHDPALFDQPPSREQLYKFWVETEGALNPATQQPGRVGLTNKSDDWRFFECDRAGETERRHKTYELRQKARAKKKAKA